MHWGVERVGQKKQIGVGREGQKWKASPFRLSPARGL
jgi:hypothetical protein